MHLSVTCPRCESKYQLDAGMRGKRMRCPNPICWAVFEVHDKNDEPALSSPAVEAKPVAEPIAKEWPPPSPPKPVEATKPQPVKREPIPIPVQPQPAPDFADDFPGDDEAAPVPTTPAIATQAWQPEAWEAPRVREDVAPAPVREAIAPPLPTPAP